MPQYPLNKSVEAVVSGLLDDISVGDNQASRADGAVAELLRQEDISLAVLDRIITRTQDTLSGTTPGPRPVDSVSHAVPLLSLLLKVVLDESFMGVVLAHKHRLCGMLASFTRQRERERDEHWDRPADTLDRDTEAERAREHVFLHLIADKVERLSESDMSLSLHPTPAVTQRPGDRERETSPVGMMSRTLSEFDERSDAESEGEGGAEGERPRETFISRSLSVAMPHSMLGLLAPLQEREKREAPEPEAEEAEEAEAMPRNRSHLRLDTVREEERERGEREALVQERERAKGRRAPSELPLCLWAPFNLSTFIYPAQAGTATVPLPTLESVSIGTASHVHTITQGDLEEGIAVRRAVHLRQTGQAVKEPMPSIKEIRSYARGPLPSASVTPRDTREDGLPIVRPSLHHFIDRTNEGIPKATVYAALRLYLRPPLEPFDPADIVLEGVLNRAPIEEGSPAHTALVQRGQALWNQQALEYDRQKELAVTVLSRSCAAHLLTPPKAATLSGDHTEEDVLMPPQARSVRALLVKIARASPFPALSLLTCIRQVAQRMCTAAEEGHTNVGLGGETLGHRINRSRCFVCLVAVLDAALVRGEASTSFWTSAHAELFSTLKYIRTETETEGEMDAMAGLDLDMLCLVPPRSVSAMLLRAQCLSIPRADIM
ncbi:hypothetical protein KIPB_007529, partial [Kipferlia bialata]|eukprot:g7529.t1